MSWGLVRRGTTRLVVGALSAACTITVVGGAFAPAHASDDYPYAWQGQCPIVPQEPLEEPTPTATPAPSPHAPGAKPGTPTPTPTPPPPPPVLDPVSGHMYDPRGPKPECARRIWEINGSMGDPWGFVLRNCTSFVAWRLNELNGLPFANDVETQDGEALRWSDAKNWDDTARALGHRVDDTPAIGAVAQSDAGRVGHVAYVVDIDPGTVTIEEYNHATPGGYGVRTVPTETFRYLHLKDVAPSPLVGSQRPLVAMLDSHDRSWTARVSDAGILRVAAPGHKPRPVGAQGVFSPLAAPALALDGAGRIWVAATTRDGRVLAGTKGKRGWRLRDIAAAAPTSSPALATTRGRLSAFTISGEGTLDSRELKRNGTWSRPHRIGRAATWATHTAPVAAHDAQGRTWLVAVTSRGNLLAQHTSRRGWTRLQSVPGPTAVRTSTPSLTLDASGTLHLHQVTGDGRIQVRSVSAKSWSHPQVLSGEWSPYSSPAVRKVAGGLQLTAVTAYGRVRTRPALPGVELEPAGPHVRLQMPV